MNRYPLIIVAGCVLLLLPLVLINGAFMPALGQATFVAASLLAIGTFLKAPEEAVANPESSSEESTRG